MANDGRALAYMDITEIPTATTTAATGDWSVFFDTSTGSWSKENATGVISLTATDAITAAEHAGRLLYVTGTAAATYTLPAAGGTGDVYEFIIGEVNTNGTVIQVVNATDEFAGTLFQTDVDTSDTLISMPCLAADNFDTVTLNGTTKGGIVGDTIRFVDGAAGAWVISGHTNASGTVASPLSAAVS